MIKKDKMINNAGKKKQDVPIKMCYEDLASAEKHVNRDHDKFPSTV